jgi:hypothetical protein
MKKLLPVGFSIVLTVFLAAAIHAETLTIPHTAFTGQSNTIVYARNEGYVYKDVVDSFLQAPVYLPNGAIIEGIKLFYYDNGGKSIQMVLCKQNLVSGIRLNIFGLETTGVEDQRRNIADWTLDAGGSRAVDNKNNTFWLNVMFNGTGTKYRVYAAQIIYHMPPT